MMISEYDDFQILSPDKMQKLAAKYNKAMKLKMNADYNCEDSLDIVNNDNNKMFENEAEINQTLKIYLQDCNNILSFLRLFLQRRRKIYVIRIIDKITYDLSCLTYGNDEQEKNIINSYGNINKNILYKSQKLSSYFSEVKLLTEKTINTIKYLISYDTQKDNIKILLNVLKELLNLIF